MTQNPPKKSDLGVRTLSALVMVTVAGTALWLGGWWWTMFVAFVALGVLWEWWGLVVRFANSLVTRLLWGVGGIVYIGLASLTLWMLRIDGAEDRLAEIIVVLWVVAAVVATDIGAYFAGRTFGGPKIAPRISPSKTWSGLIGGMVCAGLMLWCLMSLTDESGHMRSLAADAIPLGAAVALVAQAGDFFESWMKRRAGVKDSGKLIPGHGGLFDRVDGLLSVLFVASIPLVVMIVSIALSDTYPFPPQS